MLTRKEQIEEYILKKIPVDPKEISVPVEDNENTWMYKPKFVQKQVGIDIKYKLK